MSIFDSFEEKIFNSDENFLKQDFTQFFKDNFKAEYRKELSDQEAQFFMSLVYGTNDMDNIIGLIKKEMDNIQQPIDAINDYIACGIIFPKGQQLFTKENPTECHLNISVPEKSDFSLAGMELSNAFQDLLNYFSTNYSHLLDFLPVYTIIPIDPSLALNIKTFKLNTTIRNGDTWNKKKYEKRKFFIENMFDVEGFMPELFDK